MGLEKMLVHGYSIDSDCGSLPCVTLVGEGSSDQNNDEIINDDQNNDESNSNDQNNDESNSNDQSNDESNSNDQNNDESNSNDQNKDEVNFGDDDDGCRSKMFSVFQTVLRPFSR